MAQGLKHITHENGCRKLGLLNLEKEEAKQESDHSLPLPKGREDTARLSKKVQHKSQRNCGISIPGHFQNSGGQGLEQLDLTLRFTLL